MMRTCIQWEGGSGQANKRRSESLGKLACELRMEGGREEDIHTIGISNSLDRLLYFKSAVSLEWFQDTPTFIILLISHHILPVLSGVLRYRENIRTDVECGI